MPSSGVEKRGSGATVRVRILHSFSLQPLTLQLRPVIHVVEKREDVYGLQA